MIKDGLTFDINIITIGVDFYSLYMAEKKENLLMELSNTLELD